MTKPISELSDREVSAGAFAEQFDADSREINERFRAGLKAEGLAAVEQARRARQSANRSK